MKEKCEKVTAHYILHLNAYIYLLGVVEKTTSFDLSKLVVFWLNVAKMLFRKALRGNQFAVHTLRLSHISAFWGNQSQCYVFSEMLEM